MMDIVDSVISKVAALHNLAKQMGSLDLQKKIVELEKELILVRKACNGLLLENVELKEKTQNLEDIVKGNLVFRESAYFHKDTGEMFCCGCLDGDRVLARLVPTLNAPKTYKCPRCKNRFFFH